MGGPRLLEHDVAQPSLLLGDEAWEYLTRRADGITWFA